MPKARSKRVLIRLSGVGIPLEVCLAPCEKKAVWEAARAAGYRYLSPFIRDMGLAAALPVYPRTYAWEEYESLSKAAEACNLHLGEWFRVVVLMAVGHSPLPTFLAGAKAHLKRVQKAQG